MSTINGLVDFHCHLDLYPDHQAAVEEAEDAGVFTLAVTTTPRAWPRNHESMRPRLNCGTGTFQRRDMLAKSVLMLGHASTSPWIFRSKFFSTSYRSARIVGARSSRFIASVLQSSSSITSSPIFHQDEAKLCFTGLRAQRQRRRAR